jgi:hypothetical protein
MADPPDPLVSTGTLRIGDQWNAISILAHSQTHPLKAICELTENALDAGGRRIRIVRRRQRGEFFLEVEDDGRGVAPDAAGDPDLERIATHLCDSMKRHLDPGGRKGVHGEFGIGLLSFWAVGEELRMISTTGGGRAKELHLVRGRREYAIRPVRGRIVTGGTRVVLGPLLESTRKLVTGEKIARYLSAELRDRIRATGAEILVSDRVARREIAVAPREFTGERLDLPRRYATPLGDVQVEAYVRAEAATGEPGIALCKDGTRVLKEIAELLPFQHHPWTDRRLEGLVDFEPLMLAPGTRGGVVDDAALAALVATAPAIEADLVAALDRREAAETERASRQILKQVHKALVTALAELPSEEYVYFDIPKRAAEPGTEAPADPPADGDAAGGRAPAQPTLFPPEPGPLHAVLIAPRRPRRAPGGTVRLLARACDAVGTPLPASVAFAWRLAAGTATLEADESACGVTADTAGVATVEVTATHGDLQATGRVDVHFVAGGGDDVGPSQRGLPSYRLEAEHGQPWRSRYDTRKNEIVINSAHRDFLASRGSPAKHRRYIGKLYAKEVVLSNFPHETPAQALERLVEITLRTEDSL